MPDYAANVIQEPKLEQKKPSKLKAQAPKVLTENERSVNQFLHIKEDLTMAKKLLEHNRLP